MELKLQEKLEEVEKSKRPIVDREEAGVVEGFERLRRLCQIKETKHDRIENLLFGKAYKPEAKISINKLQGIFKQKLFLVGSEASFNFSRYLLEPREEERIVFDPNRTTTSCRVVIRLMN